MVSCQRIRGWSGKVGPAVSRFEPLRQFEAARSLSALGYTLSSVAIRSRSKRLLMTWASRADPLATGAGDQALALLPYLGTPRGPQRKPELRCYEPRVHSTGTHVLDEGKIISYLSDV